MVVSYLRDSVSVWQKWALPGNIQNVPGRQLVADSVVMLLDVCLEFRYDDR